MNKKVDDGSGAETRHNKKGHVRRLMMISILLAVVAFIVIIAVTR